MRSIECNRRTRMQSRDKRFNIKNESYAFDEHRFKCNRTEYGYILALTYQEITSLDHCCNMVVRELTRNYTVDMYVKLWFITIVVLIFFFFNFFVKHLEPIRVRCQYNRYTYIDILVVVIRCESTPISYDERYSVIGNLLENGKMEKCD